MKKLIVLSVCMVLVSMYSCVKQNEPAFLGVSKAIFDLPTPNDTSFVIKMYYSNNWRVESLNPSWCRVTPVEGKGNSGLVRDSINLNVVVDKNTTNKDRQTLLRISSVNLVLEPIIKQSK